MVLTDRDGTLVSEIKIEEYAQRLSIGILPSNPDKCCRPIEAE